jgi:hypothetical protein
MLVPVDEWSTRGSHRSPMERLARADAAQPRVRTGSGPATASEVVSIEKFDDSTARAVFRLIAVPGADTYQAWSHHLYRLIGADSDPQHWQ